mmetsp:Transcript_46068/g.107683  ORF Transcript_46068/g.107683 Transcript_46068/m.107683 type:complete len:1153 (+) Transcript_46068:65-3523(+)
MMLQDGIPGLRTPVETAQHPFLQALNHVGVNRGAETFVSWYNSKGEKTNEKTFGDVWNEAARVSYCLRSDWNVGEGERALLCYDFGLCFLPAFLGCLQAGVVAVPVYPPAPPLAESLKKMGKIATDCSPVVALVDSKVNGLRIMDSWNPFSKTRGLWPQVTFRVTDRLAACSISDAVDIRLEIGQVPNLQLNAYQNHPSRETRPQRQSGLAYIQYTSGSTGTPKGVMVSLCELEENVRRSSDVMAHENKSDELVMFSWLPQHHDMGLVNSMIAFFTGWRAHMMSPVSFIQNPMLWLQLLSSSQATYSVAPDFAYRLVCRKFSELHAFHLAGLRNLDLSRLRVLMNAAEPIRPDTADMFEKLFAKYGVQQGVFVASYGLAEHVAGVMLLRGIHLSTPSDGMPAYVAVAELLPCSSVNGRWELENPAERKGTSRPWFVRLADADGKALGEDEVGELWVSSPSVASGYYGKAELSQVFRSRVSESGETYLRTGDLAFIQKRKLYICGRSKDLIICQGLNYFPHDIEDAAQAACADVRPGCIAAFSSDDSGRDGDLEIVFEIRKSADAAAACKTVREAVIKTIGLVPHVIAIAERSIPKTTSGKIQRRATRESLHTGLLPVQAELDHVGCLVRGHESASVSAAPAARAEDIDAVFEAFLGRGFRANAPWEELGLSSIAAVQLLDELSKKVGVKLSPGILTVHGTPAQLKTHLTPRKSFLSQMSSWMPSISLQDAAQQLLQVCLPCGAPSAGPVTPLEACVAATGTGFVDAHAISTDACALIDSQHRQRLQQHDETVSFSANMIKSTGVQTRHWCPSAQGLMSKNPESLTHQERFDIWWDVGRTLAEQAAKAALEEWANNPNPMLRGKPSDITHIIITTASGWKEPGIACHLIDKLGLPEDTQKQELHMNGCFSSCTCLRLARDIVRAGGSNGMLRDGLLDFVKDGQVGRRCVLVVALDVPSAHYDPSQTDREDLTAMSLFADGAGAAIVAPAGEWQFREAGALVVPNSKDLLGLHPVHPSGGSGIKMTLSKDVPNAVYKYLGEGTGRRIMDRLAKATSRREASAQARPRPAMAVHPGGPRILGAVHQVLEERGWPSDALALSEQTLSQRGNLGSAAALVVLHRMLHDESMNDHNDLAMLAFGPGVTVEYSLLCRCK